METRYFGNNLIAANQIQDGRRGVSSRSEEDAYYQRNAPADGRVLRIVSAAAAVWFGVAIIGYWLQ